MKSFVHVLIALALTGVSVTGCRGSRAASAPPPSRDRGASSSTAPETAQPPPGLSWDEASEGLKQAILGARKPAILTVKVEDSSYEYAYRRGLTERDASIRVFYDQVDRIEVQDGEQRAIVHGIKGGEIDKLRFETDAEAWEFERNLSALLAHASGAGATSAEVPDEELLAQLLERAVKPDIVKAQVLADRYSYQYQRGFTRVRSNKQVQIKLVKEVRVDGNDRVRVMGYGGKTLDKLSFASQDDALRFKNILEGLAGVR